MSIHLAIIGAGQLGSRHLQALNQIDRPAVISIVDPNSDSLNIARNRFGEMPSNRFVDAVNYFQRIDDVTHDIEVAIIATTADVRRQVIEELTSKVNIGNLILEKVLFQKLADYDEIPQLLETKQIEAWVNCTRREWPFYQNLRQEIQNTNLLEFSVNGSDFGLASNLIHFIDLISYFNGVQDLEIRTGMLTPAVFESKKYNFIELFGTVTGSFRDDSKFFISSYREGYIPLTIKIVSTSAILHIVEEIGKAWVARISNNWRWEEEIFKIPFQSQLSHLTVQQILNSGTCNLTPLSESVKLHKPMIHSFLNHIRQIKGIDSETCPIT
jgi:predicted dehydrogenase